MNILYKLVMVFFSINAVVAITTANEETLRQPPNISSSLWEKHSEAGVALAVCIGTKTEQGVQKKFVKICIKNISNTDKFISSYGADSGMEVYYIDDKGVQIPLRDYRMMERKVFERSGFFC